MNRQKILFATISYVVLTMAVAYPWHMVWFHEVYADMGAYTRPEPSVPLGMISMLIQGLVIAYLYPFYYKGGNPILQGIKFSLIMGAVVYSVLGFAMAAKMNINPMSIFLFYSLAYQLIQYVLTGAALGLIYGKCR